MANPFVHVELHTRDLPAAKDFYTRLFGWKLDDAPMAGGGTYTMIEVGTGTGGGMCTCPDANAAPGWMAYVGVDDINTATALARELGARIVVDSMAIGEFGWMSVFVDPTGATLAMWQCRSAAV